LLGEQRWRDGFCLLNLLTCKLKMVSERGFIMIQLRLQPEIEAQLAAEARARGLALDNYIEELVSERLLESAKPRTVADAIARIRELRQGNSLGGLNLKDLIHEGHKY
jgi:hypothetical protein